MSNADSYVFDRAQNTPAGTLVMSPWSVQGIVYELITSFFLANTPESLGYPFKAIYTEDKSKSGIYVDVAYNYNAAAANKRPSVFISRTDCNMAGKTFGQAVGSNVPESEVSRLMINQMGVTVSCIAAPIMMAELLADYTKQAVVSFQQEIQRDFNFRRFRVARVGKPQIYVEAKEYFVVDLGIDVAYDEGWIVKQDNLKLKTVSRALFDSLTNVRLT